MAQYEQKELKKFWIESYSKTLAEYDKLNFWHVVFYLVYVVLIFLFYVFFWFFRSM